MNDFSVDRRQFTLRSALALLGGVTITVSPGCGGGGGGTRNTGTTPTGPSGASADTLGVVSNNHGHQAAITSAQLLAGGALVLNIRGDADHGHMVELTAADLVQIRSQQTVAKQCSPEGAHTHMVSFSRGGDPGGPAY